MESQKECVTYGSIISFRNDFTSGDEIPTISYDPSIQYTNYFKKKKEDFLDFLTSRFFLYTHGVFNEFCYLYNFKDKDDLKYNYFNTLFMILPSCEYEAMAKFKNLIKDLKNEILMDEDPTVNNFQILDFYIKFKQEIQTNLKKSSKLMQNDNNKINFNDCVQFLHIRTGKFLSYKTYDEYLKSYVELTDNMSKNTIFRFTPAYVYQMENSTTVFFDLTIQIACGEKKTGNEKFISNIKSYKPKTFKGKKALEFGKKLLNWGLKKKMLFSCTDERTENLKKSISNIFFDNNYNDISLNNKNDLRENFLMFSTNSNLAYKNFGKKLLPKDNYIGINIKSNDYWKLVSFSKNFLIDNNFINSLDYFCLQTTEKNIFISIEKKEEEKYENTNFINFYQERKGISQTLKDLNTILNEKTIKEERKKRKAKQSIEEEKNSLDTSEEEEQELEDKITPEPRNLFNDKYFAKLKYGLKANFYEDDENNFLEPYSLFKFEIIKSENENNDLTTIDLLSKDCYVRLISVFFNKVIAVGKKFDLILIDNIDKDNFMYNNTLFKVEKINERKKNINKEKSSEKENDNNEEQNEEENNDEKSKDILYDDNNDNITKNSYIKLKSKVCGLYIGIRVNNKKGKESIELLLTKSISDSTKFKLNFLEEKDKYELNFFEQLLWSLKNLLSFFKQDNKFISENSYEKIQHILITFEKKIKIFKDNKNLGFGKEKKFDFMKIIDYFNIVDLLINLFIANWFNDFENLDYEKFEEQLNKYFKEKNNELKFKLIISRKILKLLTLIFDLDKSFLNCIANKLLYFFMFVGRDDKCAKFLVHILKDNRILLISLCPTNIEKNLVNSNNEENLISNENKESAFLPLESYNNIKKCLRRIINDYNHLDNVKLTIYFSSVYLFFKLMNCLLIYNNKPFKPFYDYYFEDLNILEDDGENFAKPNFINNPILIDFFIKNNTIYARKERFFSNSIRETTKENYFQYNDEESEKYNINNTNNKIIMTNLHLNTSNINEHTQYKLIDLIEINNNSNIDKYYRMILFAKLVSLNIYFYSNLSLCDKRFKAYLKSLFNIKDVINNYLSITSDQIGQSNQKNKNNLNNDLKCSLVQLINYLYFRIPFPFWEKINLFKNLKSNSFSQSRTILKESKNDEKNIMEEDDLYHIIEYTSEIIESNINIKGKPGTDPFLLLQILDCIKYTLRYLYTFKNDESRMNTAFNIMCQILKLLDKYIGISKYEKIEGNLNESLNSILDDELLLKEELFLVNDKFQFLFQKLKKKLENIIKKKAVKNLKEFFKDLFGKAIAKEDKSSFSNAMIRNLKRKSTYKLKKYNLSHILLEISMNSNKERKTIISDIMYMISNIFYEFLKYIESLSIEELGNNLIELKQSYNGKANEFEKFIIEEIIKANNENYADEHKPIDTKIAKHKYIELKESNENKYLIKFKNQWNISENITTFFFKFLQINDNNKLTNLILDIIYKLNNQRKIYYRNVCNYVIFQKEEDFEKYLKIKDLILNIFENIEDINILQRLDNTSYVLFNQLNYLFDSLIKKLFDEPKWRQENNILDSYEEIIVEEEVFNDNTSSDFEIESVKFEENPNSISKNLISDIKVKKEKNTNKKLGPFLIIDDKENSSINLLIAQQTLYNLGFITIINDFFNYIKWMVDEKIDELKEELSSVELIMISIYKLMVVFIYNNSKHKQIVSDKLYVYITPLKFKNKHENLLYSIGYFLINLLNNYESMNYSSQIKNFDKTIIILNELNELDWLNYKSVIPYYVETLKIIIKNGISKYVSCLFQIFNKILDVLIKEIEQNNCTNNDILSIISILEFVILEQDKRTKEKNLNTIINLEKLVNTFINIMKILIPETLELSNLKYSKILVLVTNLIYKNIHIYRNEFFSTKKLNQSLSKALFNFCSLLKLSDSLIYIDNNQDLKYFNEFIGLSIPKLYIILKQTDKKNYLKIGDKDKCMLNLVKKFYQIILNYIMPKRKNFNNQGGIKLFMTKSHKEEVAELIKNVNNSSFKYMKLAFDKMEKNDQFMMSDKEPMNKLDKNDELINLLETKDQKKLEFGIMWNKIKLKIIYCKGLEKFHRIVKEEISYERKNFVQSIINYNQLKNSSSNNFANIKDYDKNLRQNLSFFATYSKYFIEYYGDDLIKNKNELYFFYWSSIFLMEYDLKEKCFNKNKTRYNKEYFDKNLINFTLKQFHNINFASSSYENLLFLMFFNSYLYELDDKNKENCLGLIINSPESENLFNLIRNILDKLSNKINLELDREKNKIKTLELFGPSNDDKNEENTLNFPSNLFENDLNEYIQTLDFLIHFSKNNQKMKDFLRYQNNNNSKNHNFIIILSGILESFIQDENPKNKNLLEKYFIIIIKIIECLTKCCISSSYENQDCIVKETNVLKFTKFILDKITYREKIYNQFFSDNEKKSTENNDDIKNNYIPCLSIGLDRKKLSYLKYKLLVFLSILTVGRDKSDKIYELIHQIIDFNVFVNSIVETYKEILIEKKCQNIPEQLNFDENMLLRNNKEEYWSDIMIDNDFIIYEIGTYSYLLINIYLENLTRPIDFDIYDKILKIKNQLKKDKCKVVKKSILEDIYKFFKCFGKIFRNLITCSSGKNENEDFHLSNSFAKAYKFYFEYTPEIEIIYEGQIIKYYIKLSPICKCLTSEMKDEFNKNLDRTSTKTKLESLFNNVEYLQYQLNDGKNRMDTFQKHPILDLLFNQYNFYMDVFYIISILLNLLIFCSYYRTDDDKRKVENFSEDFEFRYGFLYKKNYINVTEQIIFYIILLETIFGCLILINYFIIRIPYLTFYKNSIFYDEDENVDDEIDNKQEKMKETDKYYSIKMIISVIINIFTDGKLIFHLLLFLICILSLFIDYRFAAGLLIDVIKKSKFLMMIAIVVWEAKMQLIALIFLFYLIAYYLIIFIYLFIPDQAHNYHCFSFMECFFTLCDQTIKNSNGVINYLSDEGLYSAPSLWVNIRFYVDNIFAILEYFIVLQIFTAVIIIGFTLKTKEYSRIEKDKNNKCFICGLKKSELDKYYNQLGFNGHIKLDHYLWNYMFAIFNVIKKEESSLISLDKLIYDNYKKKSFSNWIPFQTCKIKDEEDSKRKEIK